jgi:transcriptional pleiotropic regulator of transition state genes
MEDIKMKSTGIVRKIDILGRIVLPMELRKSLKIEVKDALEIYVEGEQIILKKYKPGCDACGEISEVISLGNVRLCKNCANLLIGKTNNKNEEER